MLNLNPLVLLAITAIVLSLYVALPYIYAALIPKKPIEQVSRAVADGTTPKKAAKKFISGTRRRFVLFQSLSIALLMTAGLTGVSAVASLINSGESANTVFVIIISIASIIVLTAALVAVKQVIERRIKSDTPDASEQGHGKSNLSLLALATYDKPSGDVQRELLRSFFRFNDDTVEKWMTPRNQMAALPATIRVREAIDALNHTGFSLYPVYDRELDSVIGVLHFRELLDAAATGATGSITTLVSAPLKVKRNTPLTETLHKMRLWKTRLAIVVDDNDKCIGIIGQEDLLDAMIHPEKESTESGVKRVADDLYEFTGDIPVADFLDKLGADHDHNVFETTSDYVFTTLGRKPRVGDGVFIGDIHITVLDVSGTKATRMRAKWPPRGMKTSRDDNPVL